MTADVNVTEKVARAKAASHDRPVYTIDYDDARTMLSALADPEVLAGIVGVLHATHAEHYALSTDPGLRPCGLCHAMTAAGVEWLRKETNDQGRG